MRNRVGVREAEMCALTTRARMSALLQQVAAVALPGEQARGNGGVVVLASTDQAMYRLLHEIESEELRERLQDLLSEHGQENVVVVQEQNATDDAETRAVANIWMVARAKLAEIACQT